MKSFAKILALLLTTSFCSTLYAADISIEKPGRVLFVGPIEIGDAEKLVQIQARHIKNTGHPIRDMRLNSLGGQIIEAMRIAQLIEAFRIDTQVSIEGSCVSACFIIFVAGGARNASGFEPPIAFGRVGIHRPFLNFGRIDDRDMHRTTEVQHQVTMLIRDFLARRSVPTRIIDTMMTNSSQEVYWLDSGDLIDIGFRSNLLEEILIAKCGAVSLTGRILTKPYPNATTDETLEYMDRLSDCEEELKTSLRKQEVPQYMKRISSGWRPWETKRSSKASSAK